MIDIIPDIFNAYRGDLIHHLSSPCDESKLSINCETDFLSSSDSSGSSPSPTDSDDSPTEEYSKRFTLLLQKKLNLSPSCFRYGCVCGHHIEFRDIITDTRKRKRLIRPGVTIRPKTPPIVVSLRK